MQRVLARLPQRPRRGRIDADRGLQRRRAVDRQERPLGQRSRSHPARRRARRRSAGMRSPASRRTDCRRRPACGPRAPARPSRPTGAIIGFASENSSYCSRSGCSCCIHSASGRADERANDRLREGAVEREIDLRHAGGGREAALVGRIVAAERANIVERPRLAAHHPVAGHEIGIGRVLGLGLEHRLVEAGRQRVDQVDVAGELAVLLSGDAAGDEDAEMTDASHGSCRRSSDRRSGSRRRPRRDRESIRAPAAAA